MLNGETNLGKRNVIKVNRVDSCRRYFLVFQGNGGKHEVTAKHNGSGASPIACHSRSTLASVCLKNAKKKNLTPVLQANR